MERNKDFIFYHDDLKEAGGGEDGTCRTPSSKPLRPRHLENIGHQFEIFFQPKVEIQGVTQDSLKAW
jgi:hypothetical protein